MTEGEAHSEIDAVLTKSPIEFKAPSSIGSPNFVPVPCASTIATLAPPTWAARNRSRCADGFGAVNPFDRPSWPKATCGEIKILRASSAGMPRGDAAGRSRHSHEGRSKNASR